MSKRRSGLAFQRRAYHTCCPPVCPAISLASIATLNNPNIWFLNANTTILACQTLLIPADTELQTNSFTLTNNGTITLRGHLRNADSFHFNPTNYVTINNGIINILGTGTLVAVFNASNQFINNTIVNNRGFAITAQQGGICINNGVINNFPGSRIQTNISTFENYGTINNSGGTIFVNPIFSTFLNGGIVYNNNGGVIDNGDTFNNTNGIIHNPLTDTGCGIGIFTGNNITGGIIDELCPP